MFIPYKVDVPMERWPIANWVLIGITVVVSLAMFVPLSQWDDARDPRLPPELVRDLQKAGVRIENDAAERPTIVDAFLLQPENFHFSQLVGNLFIHAGILHLAGNMLFLFVFGNAVNAKLGHAKFVLLYLGVGVVESTVWLLLGPRIPCLGASGAIMGVVGAFLLLYPLNDVSVAYWFTFLYAGVTELSAMWVIAAYAVFDVWGLVSNRSSGVAYLSHVVGFATGALLTALLLRWKVVEMDSQEKSLLQVWGWMPYDEPSPSGGFRPPVLRSAVPASPAPRPVRRKPLDDGPIPLD